MHQQTANQVLDVEGIERCTIAAVAPRVVHALPQWLLAMDGGSMGRAVNAVRSGCFGIGYPCVYQLGYLFG